MELLASVTAIFIVGLIGWLIKYAIVNIGDKSRRAEKEATIDSILGVEHPENKYQCKKCGVVNEDGSKFCRKCGMALASYEQGPHTAVGIEQPVVADEPIAEKKEPAAEIKLEAEEKTDERSSKQDMLQTKRYCKLCGAELDEDNKCTECGHQYFSFKAYEKVILYVVIFIMAFILLGAIVAIQANNEVISDLQKDLDSMTEKYNTEKQWSDSHIDEYNFYHNYAVIVGEGVTNYHRYGCERIENKSFWIYNKYAAEGHGYDPCPVCYGD